MTWEREYRNPQLVTKGEEPQKDTLRFLKWLKKPASAKAMAGKEQSVTLENLMVLDLGCGTGRNSNYIAGLGNNVTGFEVSTTALDLARTRAKHAGIAVQYQHQNIGAVYPITDNSIDLILDVTSSNSLNEKEREIYLSETARVLKPGGYFFVKTLCKDGDQNAKALIKKNPGPEVDTYINTDMELVERVFTEKDFRDLYIKDFQILYLEKKSSYTRFKNQSYKRNFWLAYLKK